MGTEEIDTQEENKFEGWKSTFDWVMRQHIEVEGLSAFPLPAKRDPVPKRVDVDVTVHNTPNLKVISWIDPNEKVVF
ncbi:Chromosome II, complete genome, related [Eimeria acervulina]|uniref:Chromosome II, complete genome, related n=1 Tax=Eimeria acervulina TaxID=5801 RepID=U6GHU1_EIMAC|nr:Chromosome II, complete genome, related [Eimeria acervulina]CDI79117.1 Chromosome II, complete genome, related [Eimeria acervulina]